MPGGGPMSSSPPSRSPTSHPSRSHSPEPRDKSKSPSESASSSPSSSLVGSRSPSQSRSHRHSPLHSDDIANSPSASRSPPRPRSISPPRSQTPSRSPTESAGESRRFSHFRSLTTPSPGSPQSPRPQSHKSGVSLDLDDVSEGSFSPVPHKRRRRTASSFSLRDLEDETKDEASQLQRKFVPNVPKLTRKPSQKLAILKLPPVVEIHSRPFERSTFNPSDSAAILYRLKEGVTEEDLVTAAMDDDGDVDQTIGNLIESNANIVTWSDGSQTLLIGAESYDFVINDAHDISQHVFSRHEDIQQACGIIERRVRIQPSTISASRVRVTAQVHTPVKRQMMLSEVVRAPDVEEKINARNAQKAAREQARLAARRRAMAQRTMTRARASGLSVSYVEDVSDADISSRYEREAELRRERESSGVNRLMEVKRGGIASHRAVRVKRRRLSKHKIEDDDESDKSEISADSEEE